MSNINSQIPFHTSVYCGYEQRTINSGTCLPRKTMQESGSSWKKLKELNSSVQGTHFNPYLTGTAYL